MGEAAAAAGDGGASAGDGGARDARSLRCRGRAPRPAAHHTAAGRRVRTGRTLAAQSALSASRADEKQLSAAAQQVRERRALVGGRRQRGRVRRGGRLRAASGQRQEGGAAAEGDAVVGAHGRTAASALPAGGRCAAAVRDGAAPHGAPPAPAAPAARRVTPAHLRSPHITLTFHYRDGRTRARDALSEYYRLAIYLLGRELRVAPVPCRASQAITKTEIK